MAKKVRLKDTIAELFLRIRARSDLREDENQFRTLVEQSPFSIQIINPEGKTIRVNRAWEKLWGITLGDLDGYNILQDKQLEHLGPMSYLKRAFSGESVLIPASEYDAHKTLGTGTKRWVQANAYPVKNKSGDIMMIVLMHEDITDRKKAEEALQKAKEELEIKVKERTSELESTVELLQKEIAERKKAEEQVTASLKEKELLLKEIHHRVKNNMTVITSLLRLQSSRIEDKSYKESFNISINRIKTMALIHEKLYKSRDMAKVNFDDYLKDIINSMYMSYGLDQQKVALKINVEDVALGIDKAIPCSLIVNELVSNSLKYAFPEDRTGELNVSLRRNDKDEIEMRISDNGIGMPEDMDFRKTDSLGLYLINALVGQLQGKIEINREKGTEFIITFKQNTS